MESIHIVVGELRRPTMAVWLGSMVVALGHLQAEMSLVSMRSGHGQFRPRLLLAGRDGQHSPTVQGHPSAMRCLVAPCRATRHLALASHRRGAEANHRQQEAQHEDNSSRVEAPWRRRDSERDRTLLFGTFFGALAQR